MQTILFIFTFIFGTLRLLTFTKLFNMHLSGFIEVVLPNDRDFWKYVDYLIFYGSIGYQIWFWFKHFNII